MEYKGYKAKITYSDEDEVFFGKILGICDLVTFEAESVSDLKNEFKLAVDDYLAMCEDLGKEPEKEFKGQFNVRIAPELHRKISIKAAQEDVSLNQIVENAIREYVTESKIKVTIKTQSSPIGEMNQELWSERQYIDKIMEFKKPQLAYTWFFIWSI